MSWRSSSSMGAWAHITTRSVQFSNHTIFFQSLKSVVRKNIRAHWRKERVRSTPAASDAPMRSKRTWVRTAGSQRGNASECYPSFRHLVVISTDGSRVTRQQTRIWLYYWIESTSFYPLSRDESRSQWIFRAHCILHGVTSLHRAGMYCIHGSWLSLYIYFYLWHASSHLEMLKRQILV